jgi:tRNA A-37 threonylcarbamoyl transferase component Bud32
VSSNFQVGGGDLNLAVQSVMLDMLRRRAAGESISDEQVVAARPDLAEQLRVELAKLQQICAAEKEAADMAGAGLTATIDFHAARTPGMLQLQCPHCREPFETETDTPLTEIVCSTCGGQFSLAGDDRETRFAPCLKSLAHFDIVERLGVGGFGTVWKARDRKLDRTVALKIPRQGMLDNDDLEKFLREARAAAQLQHPSIVRVHEVGRDGDSAFIVSDFVRGIPLNEWLTGQQPTMRQAAEICIAIAEALQHAHDRGVIHRDLKPANILIDGDGRPHLMDFGLARREVGEVTVTLDGQILGTPAYMSPEQAQGEAHTADARSDIYSLGVILFQLLTGELPFRGSARMLMHQMIHDPPPSPRSLNAHVPRDLETITLKCVEKNRDNRYQSATDLSADLRRWLKGAPVLARPIGPLRRFWRWYWQRTELIAGACTLFTGLFVVAGTLPLFLFVFLQSEGPPPNWSEEWPRMVISLLMFFGVILVFSWGGMISLRGRTAGLLLSTILFGTMAASSVAQVLMHLAQRNVDSTMIIVNTVPAISWYVVGFVLQIVALCHRFAKRANADARFR